MLNTCFLKNTIKFGRRSDDCCSSGCCDAGCQEEVPCDLLPPPPQGFHVTDHTRLCAAECRVIENTTLTAPNLPPWFEQCSGLSEQEYEIKKRSIEKVLALDLAWSKCNRLFDVVKANKTVFVVDVSGSMNSAFSHAGHSKSRLQWMKDALNEAITGFNEEVEFNIVRFSSSTNRYH